MSLDKQNFSRIVQEQQGGISPQMWPIKCPDNGSLVVNHPYEININPCDSIWLPSTYDKSYGTNPVQYDAVTKVWFASPTVCGQNVCDVKQATTNTLVGNPIPYLIRAPVFGLRFNTPNNPWLLWTLADNTPSGHWGTVAGASGSCPWGTTMAMRSISGPISRMWIMYYTLCFVPGGVTPVGSNQIILMSMLGFSQVSEEKIYDTSDPVGALPEPPARAIINITSGGYQQTDLNTADLLALGVKPSTGSKT